VDLDLTSPEYPLLSVLHACRKLPSPSTFESRLFFTNTRLHKATVFSIPSKQISNPATDLPRPSPIYNFRYCLPHNLRRQYQCRIYTFKHCAICTFLPTLVNHTEPHPTRSAHHHRTQTKEPLVFQGGYRKCFQEWPHSTSIVHHHDVFAKGPEYERKHDAGLFRHCRKISSVRCRSG
jgi:hypothetical protein